MRTSWNDEEDDALQGLPLRAQIIYLRGIRRYMDYGSRVTGGPSRRISLGMLAETAQECLNRQIQPKTTKDCIRASIEQLKRVGLIERLPDPDYLLFFLPKADADKSALKNYPLSAHQHSLRLCATQEPAAYPAYHPQQTATAPQPPATHHPTHQVTVYPLNNTLPNGRVNPTPDEAKLKTRPAPPPYQLIVNLYHDCLPGLPKVYKLTDTRRRHIKALWEDELDDLDSWRNYFQHISRSDFLMGRVTGRDGSAFVASFDFIIHPAKFIKIAEEQYHAKKIQNRQRG